MAEAAETMGLRRRWRAGSGRGSAGLRLAMLMRAVEALKSVPSDA